MKIQLIAIALAAPTFAAADLNVRFIEGAPTDRFVITNDAACQTGPVEIAIDLRASAGALIFDTTASGAGVEVFQPVRLVQGGEAIEAISAVSDGDQIMTLLVSDLAAGEAIAFTTDLDDQLTNSDLGQIRVSGAEIEGATVSATTTAGVTSGAFDAAARTNVALTDCAS